MDIFETWEDQEIQFDLSIKYDKIIYYYLWCIYLLNYLCLIGNWFNGQLTKIININLF